MTIPFIHVPDLPVGPLTIHPFGVLVATGVVIGTALASRRGRRLGYDAHKLGSFITWMLATAFISGHMLDEVFYHPEEILRRPWSLFMLWEGLSSFGGFVGAVLGCVLWKYFEAVEVARVADIPFFKYRRRAVPAPIFAFMDCVLAVFPVAWIFGRSGCSTVHDHPGARATADTLLAVGYPNPSASTYLPPFVEKKTYLFVDIVYGNYPRFDLGLLELMFTCLIAFLFALTWTRRTAVGSYIVAASLSYAPVRFVMDFYRITDGESADRRYGELTFAQWCCVALFITGFVVLARMRSMKKRGIDPTDGIRAVPEEADASVAPHPAGV